MLRRIRHWLRRPVRPKRWWQRLLWPLIGWVIIVVGIIGWILPVVPGAFLIPFGIPLVFGFSRRAENRVKRLTRAAWLDCRRQWGRVRRREPQNRS